jgi:hypothetical protein
MALIPQVSVACFSGEATAREAIRRAMRESPHWVEVRLYRLDDRLFLAEAVIGDWPAPMKHMELVARHDRAEWLAAEEKPDA